jgi:uncharacterized protein involved in response to NO
MSAALISHIAPPVEDHDAIFARARRREVGLSRLLLAYICTGLAFMVLPGTFLGVWNLIAISSRHNAGTISAPWIQAHGHAQIFGWIGTFILGIGFYSLPKLRGNTFALGNGWLAWALWTAGVSLRWVSAVYAWHWRFLLPYSATLEFVAFLIFFYSVSRHSPTTSGGPLKPGSGLSGGLDPWIRVVIAGTLGFLAALTVNLGASFIVALRESEPAFPHLFDQKYLVLCTWGFLVPFVWGFSSKWLPIFLGLRAPRMRVMAAAVALNTAGVLAAFADRFGLATVLLLLGGLASAVALNLFVAPERAPKTKDVSRAFPVFVRVAYVWLAIAGALGIWATRSANSVGIWGASRHALTVGFLALMVFCVGQRVLPAFCGMKLLFKPWLMTANLGLLTLGCFMRVTAEILAYQNYFAHAWACLPVSAVIELTAITLFALNLVLSFLSTSPALLAARAAAAEMAAD